MTYDRDGMTLHAISVFVCVKQWVFLVPLSHGLKITFQHTIETSELST